MDVILKQDVAKIGKANSIVKVKDGFARNFLIPNNLAVAATASNLKILEQHKIKLMQQSEKVKNDAEDLKARLSNLSLTISALAKEKEEEKLYGSVNSNDICLALKEEGFDINKSLIDLDEPIKTFGIYEIPLKLHPEVTTKLKVWVVKK